MATYKFQVAMAADSILARDAIVNTFHLDDHGVTSDPNGLAADTVNLFQIVYGGNRQIECKVYPTGDAPNFPVGHAIENVGQAPAAPGPREVALCLSYFGTRNLPRTRGRMYICPAISQNIGMSTVRPSNAARDVLLTLAQGIASLGGLDVDWITWSTIDGHHEKVTQAWVDDEWDTMRSRGLRATTRSTAAITE